MDRVFANNRQKKLEMRKIHLVTTIKTITCVSGSLKGNDDNMPLQLFKEDYEFLKESYFPVLSALSARDEFEEIELPSETDVREALAYLEIDPQHLFAQDNTYIPFFYYYNHVRCDILSLQIDFLRFTEIKERIQDLHKTVSNYIDKGDFEQTFTLMDKRHYFDSYQQLFDVIPDDRKYDIFIDLYTRAEYGFNDFRPDAVKQIFSFRIHSKRKRATRRNIKSLPQKDGFITIYRGVGSLSAPPEEAYSWTTSKKIASFFSNRFGPGEMYRAKVHISNVVDYSLESEREILVMPENVVEIEEV